MSSFKDIIYIIDFKTKKNRDFQAKRDLLINLKRKILEKNPDEFYFNMAKTQIKVLKIRKNIIKSKHI